MSKKKQRESVDEREFNFTPDKYSLDTEWEQQPELYRHFATELAHARLAAEQAKGELELTKAEIGKDVRDNPDDYDLVKATEASVSEAILMSSKYKAALKRFQAAWHEVNILQAAVVAADHKKKALENLVHLYGASYFAERPESAKVRDGVRKVKKKTNHRLDEDEEDDE